MQSVIEVINLSKQYRLGQVGAGTIGHDINRWWAKVRGKEDPYLKIGEENDRTSKGSGDYVWALKDISFEVKEGEVLGIIGRNGAGKSTLLKLLSRTTAPTTGSINIRGKVASLLEVGTGFHPELSGRENIYLNGAIMGMRRAEITNKLDEIIDFAGVERYIDTPVKRYSSGMYVRLAFAVAAHLEPDILIVDEVLAVGDAEFQRKCLGKMGEITEGLGRTVLLVSHQLSTIELLCKNSILLENGLIKESGSSSDIINKYLNKDISFSTHQEVNGVFNLSLNPSKTYDAEYGFKQVKVFVDGNQSVSAYSGCTLKLEILVTDKRNREDLRLGFNIKNTKNEIIAGINNWNYGQRFAGVPKSEMVFEIEFNNFPVYGEGKFYFDLFLGEKDIDFDIIRNAFYVEMRPTDFFLSGHPINPALNQLIIQGITFKQL